MGIGRLGRIVLLGLGSKQQPACALWIEIAELITEGLRTSQSQLFTAPSCKQRVTLRLDAAALDSLAKY